MASPSSLLASKSIASSLPTPSVLTCSLPHTCFPPNYSAHTLQPAPLTILYPPTPIQLTHQFVTSSVLCLPPLNHPIPSTHLFSTKQLNCSPLPSPSSHLCPNPQVTCFTPSRSVLTCSPAQDGGSLLPYDGGLRVPVHITGEVNIIS